MKASSIPGKFPVPFAANATGSFIRAIPTTTTDPNAASLDLGFPPNTFTPLSGGGVPPDGKDVNGILNQSTSWDQWYSAGAPVAYDPTFSGQIGGYPKGAVVMSGTNYGYYWLSTTDDNTSDPDTGGANWIGFAPAALSAVDSGAQNALAITLAPVPPSLAALTGKLIIVKAANANTISTPTVVINGFSALTIVNPGGTALSPGQIAVGAEIGIVPDGTNAQLVSGSVPNIEIQVKYVKLTTPGSGTYTPTLGTKRIVVRMIGGGGGGGSAGSPGNAGTNGTSSVFNSIFAAFGLGGGPGIATGSINAGGAGGLGGSAGSGTASLRISGSPGYPGAPSNASAVPAGPGGTGGSSPFFSGAGPGGLAIGSYAGQSAVANTGAGGGGSTPTGVATTTSTGGGGGSGEYVEIDISNPAASYAYTVGAKGIGGATTGGFVAGGNGADGQIVIEEYF